MRGGEGGGGLEGVPLDVCSAYLGVRRRCEARTCSVSYSVLHIEQRYVIRLSLDKLLVNLLQVVKRTNTPLIP